MRVPFPGREGPLEKEMASCSSVPAWRIPWTEEPGGLQSRGRKEWDTAKRTHTVLIEALYTTAKMWKQPEVLVTDGWFKKMWWTRTMEYYSAIKNSEIMPTWMDLEISHYMKSHKEK